MHITVGGKTYHLEQVANTNPQGGQLNVVDGDGNLKGILATWHTSSGNGDKIAGGYPGLDPDIFTTDDKGLLING